MKEDILYRETKRLVASGIAQEGAKPMGYCAERLAAEIKRLESDGRGRGLRRLLDTDPEHNRIALKLVQATPTLVTFRDFQWLMVARKHDVDDLVDIFHGKLDLSGEIGVRDNARSFFERVMSCQWRNPDTGRLEDRGDVVIPYKPVVEFYLEELHYFKDAAKRNQRLCQCGCGKPVFGQYKFASDTCRKRLQRSKTPVPA
jgi:hypothetical protein